MVDDSYEVRWANSDIAPDHLWRVINNLGWGYAEPSDLACRVDEIGGKEADGRVVRGERGREVLVKMKREDYARVQARKSEMTTAQTFGKKETKDAIVAGAAKEHGDEAAEFLHQNVNTLSVTDSRGPA